MKFYFIINSIVDFNFQYNLFRVIAKKNEDFEIIIVLNNLRKEQKLPIPDIFLNKIKYKINQIGVDKNRIIIFYSNKDFIKYFLKLKGSIISLTPTLKQILLKTQKPIFQRWFAISYFNEDNEIYDFIDSLIVSTKLDKYFMRYKKRILIANPYIDFFYNIKSVNKPDKETVYLIPEIIENINWFSEIKEYIANEYNHKILYIIKLRYKTDAHNIKKTEIIDFFKDKHNIIFFDSPFYDCSLNLLKICDKIVFLDKRSLFIFESSFFKSKIHIIDKTIINHHKPPANNAYYEYLENNEKLCDTVNNAQKMYHLILNYKIQVLRNIFINLLSKSLIVKKLIFNYRKKKLYLYNLSK